jgi:meso-butanediol dehydrogenase/(S,S)-butanediol dehydrogenase/diacetyl reductase
VNGRAVAVVTGGGRGLGRGIAVALAETGFDVVVGWAADEVGANETVDAVRAAGARAVAVQGDVAERGTADRLAETALGELGGLTAWVNNAGVSALATVEATDPTDLRRMWEVNVLGTLHGIQVAVPLLRERGGGRIVNIASDLGVRGAPYLGAYAATKFAVVGLTQSAAAEVAGDAITVNAVCPGTAETGMVAAEWAEQSRLTGASPEDVRGQYLDEIPIGRFCAPEDVGAAVAYLAGPSAGFVTGQSICVNGGTVLR